MNDLMLKGYQQQILHELRSRESLSSDSFVEEIGFYWGSGASPPTEEEHTSVSFCSCLGKGAY